MECNKCGNKDKFYSTAIWSERCEALFDGDGDFIEYTDASGFSGWGEVIGNEMFCVECNAEIIEGETEPTTMTEMLSAVE